MSEKERNASASIFGWQFQINVAIYLMIKYFKLFESMKIEGKKEDIEIKLKNKNKMYIQAKSQMNINYNNTRQYPSKLKEALDSLSDVDSKDIDKLVYISNLEPNPLNSNKTEFELVTFLKYSELSPESKDKVEKQLKNLGKEIDREKLVIAKIPFFGEDIATRKKFIYKQLESFLSFIKPELLPYSKQILEMLETDFYHNATQKDPYIEIAREEILWMLIVFELKRNRIAVYDDYNNYDEEDFELAVEKYSKIIDYKEGNFKMYNSICTLYDDSRIKNPNLKVIDFVKQYSEEIYNIIFENNKNPDEKVIEIICSQIVARKIILRKNTIVSIFRKAEHYEN